MTQELSFSVKPKLLGSILQEASLVSQPQIELALRDQAYYPDMRLGEIFAMRGWIKQETADFFAKTWTDLLKQNNKKHIGYYLQESALIEEKNIKSILEEQRATGVRFGAIAVLQGLIKSQTLDFFLMNLYPIESSKSSLVGKHQVAAQSVSNLKSENFDQDTFIQVSQAQPEVEEDDDFEINWIG